MSGISAIFSRECVPVCKLIPTRLPSLTISLPPQVTACELNTDLCVCVYAEVPVAESTQPFTEELSAVGV